jgi:hypothetical protein
MNRDPEPFGLGADPADPNDRRPQPARATSTPFGNSFQAVRFWKDRGGVVHLEGTAEQTFSGPGMRARAIFLLPAGYRPAARLRFAVRGFDPTNADRGALTNVDIDAEGRVAARPGDGGVVPLDGISFRP